MGLVGTWTRQVVRAAAASLIAPLALLLAAGLVASGGGLSGFGSLRQIASGPSLPDTGLDAPQGSALDRADIVGADLSESAAADPPALAPGSRVPAAPSEGVRAAGDRTPSEPGGRSPSKKPLEPREPRGNTKGGGAAPVPPAPPTRKPPTAAPAPVENLLEATRGLGDSLLGPLEPVTNDILDLLRGPPPQ